MEWDGLIVPGAARYEDGGCSFLSVAERMAPEVGQIVRLRVAGYGGRKADRWTVSSVDGRLIRLVRCSAP